MLEASCYDDFVLDQKKLEECIAYENFLPESVKFKTYNQKLNEVLRNGLRTDGRKSDESRKIYIKLGALVEARGSCYLEMGRTKVMAGVAGPREIPASHSQAGYSELGALDCSLESFPPRPGDKALSDALKRAIEPSFSRNEFPNLEISISVMVLEDGGSVLAAAITAASLALIHGRLPVYDILTSVTLGIHEDLLFVDPTDKEEAFCLTPGNSSKDENHGLITVSYMSTADQIAHYYQNGSMDLTLLLDTTEIAIKRCKDIYALCQEHLMTEVKTSLQHVIETENVEDSMKNLSTS